MRQNKKRIGIVTCAVLVVAVIGAPVVSAAAIPSFEEAVIIAEDVNMRLRPTVDSPAVLRLENGTRVGVFCEEEDGWYRIIYGNYRGYVSKDFVFLPSTDALVGNVLEDETPVYQNAGEYAEVVGHVNAGAGVAITSIQGDYYAIEYAEEMASGEIVNDEAGTAEDGGEPAQPGQAGDSGNTGEQNVTATEEDATMVQGYIKKEVVNLSASKNAANLIKEGMKGVEVTKMQQELKARGFLGASATGEFASQTKAAVTLFQEFADLPADGVAGAQTLALLYGDNDIVCTYAQRMGISGSVQLLPWDEAETYYSHGAQAKITDVRTGISWHEERMGGWYHADSEPVSAEDTAKMKEAAGGSWTWDRRPIWVTVDGITIAASMNCMPHLGSTIDDNNFNGHHCIHFYKSKVHETSAECPRHQAQVQYAYKQGQAV